ncbi:hypothetical protein Athai_10000 [Actinocatenispora thailandica]|uniref:Uncharacterized protein n=1 Tax=Actinocatenispora thailandica TaxID=227318 RepID=A0A7R7DLD9_9ACTN|nr:hypothetical protein [Actinocatenispora thailandica]BCJ33497.1 hypothetical protein Athai_10000 [Actinocatenispora thailandica]
MSDGEVFAVTVPEELGEHLFAEGFEEAFVWRGPGPDTVSGTLEFVGSAVSLGANAVAVLVGVAQLRALAASARAWLRRRRAAGADSVRLELAVRRGPTVARYLVEVTGEPDDAEVRRFTEAVAGMLSPAGDRRP